MSLDEVQYENVEVLVVPTSSTMQKAAQSAPVEPGFKLSADWIKGFLNAPCSKTTHTASWFAKFVEWMSRPAETQRQYKWTFDAAVEWGFSFNVLVPVKAEGAIHRLMHRLQRGVVGRSSGQEVNGATVNWESPLLQPGGPGIVRCLCHQYMKREWCEHVCAWMLKNEILTLPRQYAGHHFGASGYQGRPIHYASGQKRQYRVKERGGAGLGERSPKADKAPRTRPMQTSETKRQPKGGGGVGGRSPEAAKNRGAPSMPSSVSKRKLTKKQKDPVKVALEMESPAVTPQKRGGRWLASPGHPTSQSHEHHASCKRLRAGIHGSPVVQTVGQKQRFVLDSDADEAVDDERLMLAKMSLTQIKARCFGKCYVARSLMLIHKMSVASSENGPHEHSLNGLMAAKTLQQGTVVAILSHGAVMETSDANTVCIGQKQYQKYECPKARVARIARFQEQDLTDAVKNSLQTELALAGAVANEADSEDVLNAVIVTVPAVSAGPSKRKPCSVLITAKQVLQHEEILVDYGHDPDQQWQHRH